MTLTLEDVVGLEYQKEIFYDAIILPLREKENYNKLVLEPEKIELQKNFLFYGPPGTGKTFLAKALANSVGVKYEYYSSTEFLRGLVGEGAKELRKIYQNNEQKLIFLDEIDAIGIDRGLKNSGSTNDILLELLTQLDGFETKNKIITIGATNKKELLDSALLSRFNYKLKFESLNYEQRKKLVEKNLSYFNNKISNTKKIIEKTENMDARTIKQLFNYVKTNALKNKRNFLINEDFNIDYNDIRRRYKTI